MCFESRFKGTFKVMESGMEVGRALWVGSHGALWKVVTRGQPTGWHPWSASHCLCFRSSKVASFLSVFGGCLLKHGLGYFSWNNKSWGRIWTHLWMKLLNSVSTQLHKMHVNWHAVCAPLGLCSSLKSCLNIHSFVCKSLWFSKAKILQIFNGRWSLFDRKVQTLC